MLVRAVVAIVLLLLLPAAGIAQAEKRIALLIGNRAYDASVGVLKNPHNDIAVVALDPSPRAPPHDGFITTPDNLEQRAAKAQDAWDELVMRERDRPSQQASRHGMLAHLRCSSLIIHTRRRAECR